MMRLIPIPIGLDIQCSDCCRTATVAIVDESLDGALDIKAAYCAWHQAEVGTK